MKFGKRLKHQMRETLPSWRDKFLAYKDLKKLVKLISSAPAVLNGKSGKAEAEFVYLLNNEIDKFNAFFMEQEEDFIIRNKVCSVMFVLDRILDIVTDSKTIILEVRIKYPPAGLV